MKILTLILLFVCSRGWCQNSIAHVSVWIPKAGHKQNFENGYKQHLQWHAANQDTWSWYGWYVISGERSGYFIDATFDHQWEDFDRPVNPAGDAADNNLHTVPFGNFVKGYKMAFYPQLSTGDSNTLQSRFLRIITIRVINTENAKKVFEKLRSLYSRDRKSPSYLLYQLVDGGNLKEWQLLVGHNSFETFASYEKLIDELSAIERSLNVTTIESVSAETLRYQKEMSLFPAIR